MEFKCLGHQNVSQKELALILKYKKTVSTGKKEKKTTYFPTDKQLHGTCGFLSGEKFLVSAIHATGQ